MSPEDKKSSEEMLKVLTASHDIAMTSKKSIENLPNGLDQCIKNENKKNEKIMQFELENTKAAISTPTTVPVNPKVAKEVTKGFDNQLKNETEQSAKLKQGPEKPEAEQSSSLYKTPTLKR